MDTFTITKRQLRVAMVAVASVAVIALVALGLAVRPILASAGKPTPTVRVVRYNAPATDPFPRVDYRAEEEKRREQERRDQFEQQARNECYARAGNAEARSRCP